jgi:hypothetical protein
MLNPTLGRNLGRWAHVYFTSPPEKRERAVLELLRELEAESCTGAATGPINLTNGVPSNEASTRVATEARVIPETVLCAECGHQNAKPQRYCGMCGSPLTADEAEPRSSEREPLGSGMADLSRRESPAAQEPVFPTLSLFAQAGDEKGSHGSEIRWLRDRDIDDEDATSPVLKYVLVVLVLLVAGAFFYNRSRMQAARGPGEQGSSGVWTGTRSPSPAAQNSGNSPSATPPEAAASKPADNAPAVSEPTSTPAPVKESSSEEQKVKSTGDVGRVPTTAEAAPRQAPPKPATTREVPPVTPEASSVTNGSAELAMAEEYLTGKRGPRNSAVAATFLWKAVSKDNTTATLLLSDLYRAGDGVPKSCDQARVLLYAAARKNIPEAGRKLRDLQAGCP